MTISVIVPVYQSAAMLRACLAALAASTVAPLEVIVVNDGSTDGSARVATDAGARVIVVPDGPRGPATARNLGAAAAAGDVLLFLDADVVAHPDALAKIARCLDAHPEVDAVFGSYDDTPRDPGLVSQYRNLLHHYVHQHGHREASTFWAGCGAVRRSVFVESGGFDARYTRATIEDIELGMRWREAGHRIWLCPDIQVTHLKRWTYGQVVRTDLRDRAIPWSRLILERRRLPPDLNLSYRDRASAIAAWTVVIALGVAWVVPDAGWVAVAAAVVLVALNAPLYAFFARKRGVGLLLAAAAMHTSYLLYSSAAFALVTAQSMITNRTREGQRS